MPAALCWWALKNNNNNNNRQSYRHADPRRQQQHAAVAARDGFRNRVTLTFDLLIIFVEYLLFSYFIAFRALCTHRHVLLKAVLQ